MRRAIDRIVGCECGELTGSPCRWEGTLPETAVVEVNGARLRVSWGCAYIMREDGTFDRLRAKK